MTAASTRPTSPAAQGPIKIGISLSLSGDFSDPGKAVKRGYDLWAAYVNAHGGILGRKVELKIVNDASDPNQAVSNYQKLITGDHVDLVFGPFSSLLTGPSATVANRYHYAFLEPAGGGPEGLRPEAAQPLLRAAGTGRQVRRLVRALPEDPARVASGRRRRRTHRWTIPFSSPIADAMQKQLSSGMHVKTVYKTIYPAETTDLTPIVAKEIAPKPDMIIGGTQSEDAYSQVKGLVQAGYNPKFLFFANGANSPTEFPSKVGKNNVNGIFSCSDWTPVAKTAGNKPFVAQYVKRYGGTGFDIDNNSAEAWAVGQLLQIVSSQDRLDRQPEDHHRPAQGCLEDDRRQPLLGRQRLPER